MYLKSLEMKGFKSFADRTVLQFEPGISVIVGPNGSGKSNIADAVLWVMGEQSPRNLRGTRMEDVIFSGSASRGPLSMAEVSLVFDNSGRAIPLDCDEVVVTRQLYRSGESEYLLNRAPVRLLDIQELLSDFGVGRELTAVIGQNRLDRVVSSRPEERRFFIEEAAGLLKHRRRKEKALRKLEAVEKDMVRLGDIISEVRRTLKPLERQAAVASRYREVQQELRRVQIGMVVAELADLQQQWENRAREEERIRVEFEERQGLLHELRKRLSENEEEARRLREELGRRREALYRLSSCLERIGGERGLLEERLGFYLSGAGAAGDVAASLFRRRTELEGSLREVEERLEDSRRQEEECSRALRDAERERFRAAGDLAAAERERARLSEEMRRCRREAELLRKKAEEIRTASARESERGEDLAARLRGAAESVRQAQELSRRLEAGMRRCRRELAAAEARRAELREQAEELRGRAAEISERRRACEGDELQLAARLQALQELFDRRVDYAAAAARVLQEEERFPGIKGMLLHHVKIDPAWERALESFLGPWLFSLVAEGAGDAARAAALLREEGGGFALFLCLDGFRRKAGGDALPAAHVKGALSALQALEGDETVIPLLEHLLGDVALCEGLQEAMELAEIYDRVTFITREGEMVAPRGTLKGGRQSPSPFHLLAKRREIEQLQEALEDRGEDGMRIAAELKMVEEALRGLESELRELDEAGKRQEEELHRLELERREAFLREESAGNALRENERQLEESRAALEELTAQAEAADRDRETHVAAMESLRPELDGAEKRLRLSRSRLEEREEAVRRAHREHAAAAERVRHLEERREELLASLEELPEDAGDLEERISDEREAMRRFIEALERLGERGESLRRRYAAEHARGEEGLSALEEGNAADRRELEVCEARVEELRELVHNRDLVVVQLRSRVDMLAGKLVDEFRIPVEQALRDYLPDRPLEELRQLEEELRSRKEAMGQVNLLAEEEYRNAQERHRFLTEQVEDLRQSKAALAKVVRAVDREIMSIFKETFDQVNLHFQELFARLFPQGRAELVLTDPEDLLNTGVEIEAQPSGKRLKKLSLLSGGETALASLAFLFAIFKTRPSPFYFLDEVEAALDDVNLHRFLRMLDDFKEDSQLIIITHQKRTMEISDVLYGVSMQAEGVSRVLSRRFQREQEEDAVPA